MIHEHSITNPGWEQNGVFVKYFPRYRWNIISLNVLKLLFLDTELQGLKDGKKREIEGRRNLSEIGVKTSSILGSETRKLYMEFLNGPNMREELLNSDVDRCFNIGRRKGEQLNYIHENKMALIDSRISNTVLKDDELYLVDLELFTREATTFQKKLDLISLESSSRLLPTKKYRSFIKGFQEGYGKKYKNLYNIRLFITFFTGIWLGLFGEKSVKKTFLNAKNWFGEFLKKI